MDIDSPPRSSSPRGTKRSAASVDRAKERTYKDNNEGSKTAPQKGDKAVTRRAVYVVVRSPVSLRRELCHVEDAQSKESGESKEVTADKQWVGKGKVRSMTLLKYNTDMD